MRSRRRPSCFRPMFQTIDRARSHSRDRGALHSHPAIGESRVPPHGSGIRSMNDYVLYHLPTTPMDILSFWFSDKSRPKWFAKEPSFDAVVSARYGAVL